MFKQHDPPIPVLFVPSDNFTHELARLSKLAGSERALRLLYEQLNPGRTRRKNLKPRILGHGDIKKVSDSLCKQTSNSTPIKKPIQSKQKSTGTRSNILPSTSSKHCNCSQNFGSRNSAIQKLSFSEHFKYFVNDYEASLNLYWDYLRKFITFLK
jgi:hypothetical protein